MARTTTSYALFHVEETARAARAAHALMMQNARGAIHTPLYVYYKPMRIEAFPEDAEIDRAVWTLAFSERVPDTLTEDALVAWFAARTGRIPYLTEGA